MTRGGHRDDERALDTLCVWGGEEQRSFWAGATQVPVVHSVSFGYRDLEHWQEVALGQALGHIYSRNTNPTVAVFEEKVRLLEGAAAAVSASSGMAAISATLLTLLERGDRVVSTKDTYGGTDRLFQHDLPRLGIEVALCDTTDEDAIRREIAAGCRMVYLETPTNPTVKVVDLASLSRAGHDARAVVVVDNTFATPINQNPLALGADLVIHSATKFLGGHADALGGVVCGDATLVRRIFQFREIHGASLDAMAAYLLLRGMKTLALRVERQNANALAVARFLEGHRRVARVFYPGLESHPQHEIARRQMRGFGGVLSFEPKEGDLAAVGKLLHGLRFAHAAANLGAVETVAGPPSTTSHVECTAAERAAMGIPEGLVRYSVGIEAAADLIADLDQALLGELMTGAAAARTTIDAPSGGAAPGAVLPAGAGLTRTRLVAYSTAALAIDMVVVPITAVLPAFYAKYTAATLKTIGVWLVVTMFWDAVSDQVIGYLSDRTRGRFGSRKPWIVLGAIVTSVAVMFLFRPSPDSTVIYFGVWALVFYAGWAMMTIPYTAWGAELSNDYGERSRIVTYRQVAGFLGGLLFLAAPLLLPFESTDMNPQVMAAVAWITLVLLPAAVALTVTVVPAAPTVPAERGVPLHRVILSMLRNRPFQRYLFIFVLGAIQLGFYARLLYLFLDSYLKIGDKFSHVMAATAFAGWVAIPLWLAIVNRFGKHKPWALSVAASSIVLWAFLFVEPGPGAFWPAIVISCLMAILGGCSAVAPPSLLADIIEYDRLKTGQDRAGNFFAFHLLVVKVAVAISGGVAFLMLDWFGFDPKAEVHDATARAGMLLAFVFLPNLIQLLSVPAVWKFPLDQRTQRIVRRRLEQREARARREG